MHPMLSEPLDVVTIGETMLRLTPDGCNRIEPSDSLQVHVGGSESNTAVGLARLGKRVAWISRLTDNPMGRKIAGTIAAHGVDTNHVVWTDHDRVGLYFLEIGSPPRQSQIVYDRANSAFSKMQTTDLPIELFRPGKSKWLHITGISLWLSESVRATIAKAIELARLAQWEISFDVNYRSLLCSTADARAYCQSIVEAADLVFLPRRDAVQLWQLEGTQSDEAILSEIITMRSGKTTVMTLGDQGAMAGDGNLIVKQSIEPVEPIGRLGGGDAFSAGYLSAWIEGKQLAESLQWATATARLKYSIPGDLPILSRREVERLASGKNHASIVR